MRWSLSSGAGVVSSRSMPARNALSVLPEPVGATTRVLRPRPIASQAPAWAAVGSANAARNQVRVGSLNAASGSVVVTSAILAHATDSGRPLRHNGRVGKRGKAAVAATAAVVLLVALLAWWLLRDDEPVPAVAPDPVPTTPTPTPTVAPPTGPCAVQATTGFEPTRIAIPGVVRRAQVYGVPRTPAGVVGVLPHTDNQNFAWDLGGVEPGSHEGHVLINTHTWPDGSAMGNRLLDKLQVGATIRLGDGADVACYRVTKRDEVPAKDGYPGWAATDGSPQMVIVVCSGQRLGPGEWTHRTLWFADPVGPDGKIVESGNPTPPL